MNKIRIRPIGLSDNPEIAAVIRHILAEFGANKPGTVYFDPTTDALYQLFSTENSAYFIAESAGKIVGGAGVYPTPGLPVGCCELVKLYLVPEMRGQGLGMTLMERRNWGSGGCTWRPCPSCGRRSDCMKKRDLLICPGPWGTRVISDVTCG